MISKVYIEEVEKYGTQARGKKELLDYLKNGKIPSLRQAIIMKCYDCCAFYVDGRLDCGVDECPLYPFMPYNPNKPVLRTRRKRTKEEIERFKKNVFGKRGKQDTK
jgi:hypothetical protein